MNSGAYSVRAAGARRDGPLVPAAPTDMVGAYGAFDRRLVGAEHPGLGEELVDERGLAVVDVGDDGDVAERHEIGKGVS